MTRLIEPDHDGGGRAGDGNLFVCCACGKTSTTRYGFERIDGVEKSTASPGWDESCMLNAREFVVDKMVWNATRTRVVQVLP